MKRVESVANTMGAHLRRATVVAAVALGMIAARPAAAQQALAQRLKTVGIDQNLGAQVPRDLVFDDSTGKQVRLGDYFGKKPVILTLVYFDCPMLCTLTLNDLVRTMKELPSQPGQQFDVLTVSFDPRETPEIAAAKKKNYIASYGKPEAASGWHFLTGDEASIQKLTKAVGFRYFYDEPTKQYVHATGLMILAPDGKISRYFYGIQYDPKDLRLALIDASGGKTSSLADEILVLCCQIDTATGKYTWAVARLMQVFGAALTLIVGGGILWLRRRERQLHAAT